MTGSCRKALFTATSNLLRVDDHLAPGKKRPHQQEKNVCFVGRVIMVLEEQRFIHEDLERLEQAIADRVVDEPRSVSRFCFSHDCRLFSNMACFLCVDSRAAVSRSRSFAFSYTHRRAIETSA